TAATYFNISPDGARPTEGYQACVRLDGDANLVATSVSFVGPHGLRRGPDLAGRVVAVARDGKGITLESSPARGLRGELIRTEVQFDARTVLVFSSVASGGAKLSEGYDATVVLVDTARGNIAAIINLTGTAWVRQRGDREPDAAGKVLGVARDGKSI